MTRKNPQQTKQAIQQIKTITKASDLEGINPKEEVKVNYSSNSSNKDILKSTRGLFAGSFDLESNTNPETNKYFVISSTKLSKLFSNNIFVCSELYIAEESRIIPGKEYTTGHVECYKRGFNSENNPERNLENRLNEETDRHLNKLKEMRLEQINRLNEITESNK
jgi:hypothetical protein